MLERRNSERVESEIPQPQPPQSLDPDQLGKKLLEAAKKGDMEEAESLLLSNADIHYEDTTTATVEIEGDGGWDVCGCTALHWAALYNRVDFIPFLLHRGADIHCRSVIGATPLHSASIRGHTQVVTLLLHHRADIHSKSNDDGWTPLHYASDFGQSQVVAILLHYDADVHSREGNGRTPLHLASRLGYEELVALLLHHNAHIHSKNNYGETPLRLATHKAVVGLLAAAADDPIQCTIDSYSPAKQQSDGSESLSQLERLMESLQPGS